MRIKKEVEDAECSGCGEVGQVVEFAFNTQKLCEKCVTNYFNAKDSSGYSQCFELDSYEKRINNDRN